MDTESTVKFIELVRRHPMLYNKRSGSYKRSDLKRKKWHEIARAMGFADDDMATKKWKYLRDKYVRVRREGKLPPTGTGAEDSELTEWPLMQDLDFLDEFIQPRSHCSNVKKKAERHMEDENVTNVITQVETEGPDDTMDVAYSQTDDLEDVYDTQTTEDSILITVEDSDMQPHTEDDSNVSVETADHVQDNSRVWRGKSTVAGKSSCKKSSLSTPSIAFTYDTTNNLHFAILGMAKSATPSTSGTSRSSTPSSRSSTPETAKNASPLDHAIMNLGAYFARKAADDSDIAFCDYVASEMKTMNKNKKNRLKKQILNFLAESDDE